MKTLDEKPSFTFWTTLAKAFETQAKEAAKGKFMLQTQPSLRCSLYSEWLAAAGAQHWLPALAPSFPRLFRKDCRAH
jgi:hypothetical protein